MSKKKLIALIVATSSVILMALCVGLNLQLLKDRLAGRDYTPSVEIAEITETLRLTQRGEAIFYATHPQLQSKTAFNENCGRDGSAVNYTLGCYKNDDSERIYIYNPEIKEIDENGIHYNLKADRDVTVLHEILHAAYERLSKNEQADICEDLRDVEQSTAKLSSELELYDEAHYCTEAFARVGSEYLNFAQSDAIDRLTPIYGRYFEVNEELMNSYWQNVVQADELMETISNSNNTLNTAQNNLHAEIDNYYRNSTSEKYSSVNSQIAQYNDMVATHNSLVATARKIRDGLDSERTDTIESYLNH